MRKIILSLFLIIMLSLVVSANDPFPCAEGYEKVECSETTCPGVIASISGNQGGSLNPLTWICREKTRKCTSKHCDPEEPCPNDGQTERCCLKGRGCTDRTDLAEEGKTVCCPKNQSSGLVADFCAEGLNINIDDCCEVKEQTIHTWDPIFFEADIFKWPPWPPLKETNPFHVKKKVVRSECTNVQNYNMKSLKPYNTCCDPDAEQGCGKKCCSEGEFCVWNDGDAVIGEDQSGDGFPPTGSPSGSPLVDPHCCPVGTTGCGDRGCCTSGQECCRDLFPFNPDIEIEFHWPLEGNIPNPDIFSKTCVDMNSAIVQGIKVILEVSAIEGANFAGQLYCLADEKIEEIVIIPCQNAVKFVCPDKLEICFNNTGNFVEDAVKGCGQACKAGAEFCIDTFNDYKDERISKLLGECSDGRPCT